MSTMAKKSYQEITCVCDFEFDYDGLRLNAEIPLGYIKKCISSFTESCLRSPNLKNFKIQHVPLITKGALLLDTGNSVTRLPEAGSAKITFYGYSSDGPSPTLSFYVTKVIMGENPDEKAVDEASKCIACAVNKKIISFTCNHLCVCSECSQKIKDCPVCRKPIEKCTRIFW